jgi:hypothetical protein
VVLNMPIYGGSTSLCSVGNWLLGKLLLFLHSPPVFSVVHDCVPCLFMSLHRLGSVDQKIRKMQVLFSPPPVYMFISSPKARWSLR